MAIIGDRIAGGPAAVPAATNVVSDSDSDHECPAKEPEFVIDMVDSLSQPLIPPRRPHLMLPHPAAAVLSQQPRHFTPWLLPQLQQLEADMPNEKECTNCLICKFVHCILVMVCVGVTLMTVAGLPAEYKEGYGALMMVCPVLIAVVALHWLMLAAYDKEEC